MVDTRSISTRKLITIVETYYMFNRDVKFAIESSIQTIDEDEQSAILSLWKASFAGQEEQPQPAAPLQTDTEVPDVPYHTYYATTILK